MVLTGLQPGGQGCHYIALPEFAPESGAATQVEQNPIFADRLLYDRPLAPLDCRRLRQLQLPACVDRPCAVNEEDLVKSAGCGVFPQRAAIRFSVARDGSTAI